MSSPLKYRLTGLTSMAGGALNPTPYQLYIDGIYARLVIVQMNQPATIDGIDGVNFLTLSPAGPIEIEFPVIYDPNGVPYRYDQRIRITGAGANPAGFLLVIYLIP